MEIIIGVNPDSADHDAMALGSLLARDLGGVRCSRTCIRRHSTTRRWRMWTSSGSVIYSRSRPRFSPLSERAFRLRFGWGPRRDRIHRHRSSGRGLINPGRGRAAASSSSVGTLHRGGDASASDRQPTSCCMIHSCRWRWHRSVHPPASRPWPWSRSRTRRNHCQPDLAPSTPSSSRFRFCILTLLIGTAQPGSNPGPMPRKWCCASSRRTAGPYTPRHWPNDDLGSDRLRHPTRRLRAVGHVGSMGRATSCCCSVPPPRTVTAGVSGRHDG